MPRYKLMVQRADGWCDWVEPVMAGYKMSCCDCGLVHDMQFAVLKKGADLPDGTWEAEEMDPEKFRVRLRARRNKRATASARRARNEVQF